MDGRFETGYRLLFLQPRMVRDLLRGFLREEWIGWLDPATLERLSGPGSRPDGPLVWRLRWQGGSDWVYLLLRPEIRDDPFAPLRLELDRGLLYRVLLRHAPARPRLPAVVPVALYAGEAPWPAPRDARELFLPLPPALQSYVPATRYLLLDAAGGPIPSDCGEDNLVALLCELERARTPAEIEVLLDRLAALLAAARDETLRRAWSVFLGRWFLPRRFPRGSGPEVW
ncbi:MAG: Rpn family recombination-promoting nuclease/putative transposase [Thermoanaerobaculia bacterium]